MAETLVVVQRFLTEIEAQVALSALQAAGIDAMILKDDCGGMRPHMWVGQQGIRLLIKSQDWARAQEILSIPATPIPEENW